MLSASPHSRQAEEEPIKKYIYRCINRYRRRKRGEKEGNGEWDIEGGGGVGVVLC
jgi:hypothetical protein